MDKMLPRWLNCFSIFMTKQHDKDNLYKKGFSLWALSSRGLKSMTIRAVSRQKEVMVLEQ